MWRALREGKYHVWYHPQEDDTIRIGPDGTFRDPHHLTELDAVLDLDGDHKDVLEVRVDGRRVRARYETVPDVDLAALADSAEISQKIRADRYFRKRKGFKACKDYSDKECDRAGCFLRHGSSTYAFGDGSKQFWNTCEDLQSECKKYRTMDAKALASLIEEHPQDVKALEARCGHAGLGKAYRDRVSQGRWSTAKKAAAVAAVGTALAGLAYVSGITVPLGLSVPKSLAWVRINYPEPWTWLKQKLSAQFPDMNITALAESEEIEESEPIKMEREARQHAAVTGLNATPAVTGLNATPADAIFPDSLPRSRAVVTMPAGLYED